MISYLFPNKCVCCGNIIPERISICDECRKNLHRIEGKLCEFCGREIPHCNCRRSENGFRRNVSVFRYDGSAAQIVKRFKMGKIPQISVYISNEMSMLIEREYGAVEFDCVTFVPMTRIKEMRRGFNHAELIAKRVSDNLHLPMRSLLKRSLGIHSQKSLNSVNRYKNVRGKFHTVKSVQGMTVLLVDDVITTGATLSECALQLKSAGAAAVFSATFASTYKK